MIYSQSDLEEQYKNIAQLKRERALARQRSLDAGLPPEYLPMALAGYDQMIEDLQFQAQKFERSTRGEVGPPDDSEG
jgi:hypothetical protein